MPVYVPSAVFDLTVMEPPTPNVALKLPELTKFTVAGLLLVAQRRNSIVLIGERHVGKLMVTI